jgi:predicted ATPase
VYVERIAISGLRSFRDTAVGFLYPGCPDAPQVPNVTLLLGDNGAGKTSVLRSVALAALAPVIASSGFRPYRLVRRTAGEEREWAEIRGKFLLHGQDLGSARIETAEPAQTEARVVRRGDFEQIRAREADARWEGMFSETSPAFLVLGYGASRRVESGANLDVSARAKSRFVRYERVAGLFEEHVTLVPLASWLPRFRSENPARHRQVITLINRLLPAGMRIDEQPNEGGEYLFEHNGAAVPFAALSDGYRAFIGWIADLLYHVTLGAPSGARLDETRGIVLLDEVDLHLHPAWQRTVVPQLASTLPNLQFILTSHSPLVVGTLHSDNLRMIEDDGTGASVVLRLHEHVHGLTADQILVSSYFGLTSPRAPEAVEELQSLSTRAQEGDRTAAREFLARLSASAFTVEERSSAAARGGEQEGRGRRGRE